MKKTRQVIGVNLACILIFFTIIQSSSIATATNESSPENITLKSDTTVIATESTFDKPVLGYISQSYSWHHPGVDIAGNENQPIKPIAAGKIVQIEHGSFGYGNNVIISHGDSILSRYAHMSKIDITLNQEVTKETTIGYVGSTGWSTGPHLHLEIYQNGKTINPLSLFPNIYSNSYVNIPAPSVIPAFASPQMTIQTNQNSQTASISAQVSFKEIVPGFEEPFAYTATPSSNLK